ncbi:MAG: NAD-dependent epimerase/dehydratase family protein [Chitinophagales bacterium]|nr:NAD-dependent epimerase/dehydratase family protein [Chitinophagales bacterium]
MIVITGASGFIASVLLAFLNERGFKDIILVDDFSTPERYKNIFWKSYSQIVERDEFQSFLNVNSNHIKAVIHLGSKSGYIHNDWEKNSAEMLAMHKYLWNYCFSNQIKFIYASSGAVYGDGTLGFDDDDKTTLSLKPQHPYAQVKLEIDQWSLKQCVQIPFWYGLRMSNVYGPNEYHKGANASIVLKAYFEILEKRTMTLFASPFKNIADGEMSRDFIYVKDVAKVIDFLISSHVPSGIYNVATGVDISFNSVVNSVFEDLEIAPQILYQPVSDRLKNNFPPQVALPIQKLRRIGYENEMLSLQAGVKEYLKKYLKRGEFY